VALFQLLDSRLIEIAVVSIGISVVVRRAVQLPS
jgi:hypothetical protein